MELNKMLNGNIVWYESGLGGTEAWKVMSGALVVLASTAGLSYYVGTTKTKRKNKVAKNECALAR